MNFTWGYCSRHRSECECTLTSVFSTFNPIKRCKRDFRRLDDMYADIYATVVGDYYVSDSQLYARQSRHWEAYKQFYVEYYSNDSQISLRPMTNHMNVPQATNLFPTTSYEFYVKSVVNYYLYAKLELNRDAMRPGSLQALCMERVDWHNIIYGAIQGKKMLYYTTNNISIPKQLKIMQSFDVDGSVRGESFGVLRPLVSSALSMLERALDMEQLVGKQKFRYDPRDLLQYTKLGTSGGIIPTAASKVVVDGTTYRMKNAGMKGLLFESCARQLHTIIMRICKEKKFVFQPICVTKIKQEWRYIHEKPVEDLDEASLKARDFFIPFLTLVLGSDVVYRFRMLKERGNVIRIGSTAWYGSWYELAKYLNYDNEDIFWIEGDITALDKHIKDWQLYLYFAAGMRYFDWKSMNRQQTRVLKTLIRLLMYHATNKVVLHVGSYWRFVRGIMYSGGKETSHGGSWIMAFIFYLYVSHTMKKYPHLKDIISKCVDEGYIRIVVYGDNHICCFPKFLRGVFGVESWSAFLSKFCDMDLRDQREFDTFLTIPNYKTGGIIKRGPIFLKRYFIVNPDKNPFMAKIIPYKPITETLLRALTCEEEDAPLGLVLKCIGQAWDTMNTNPVAYDVIKYAYQRLISYGVVKTPREMLESYLKNPNAQLKINKMMRRLGMTADEIFCRFPSRRVLSRRHYYRPEMCKFGGPTELDEFLYHALTS